MTRRENERVHFRQRSQDLVGVFGGLAAIGLLSTGAPYSATRLADSVSIESPVNPPRPAPNDLASRSRPPLSYTAGSSTLYEPTDGAIEAAERGGFIELFIELFLGRSEMVSSPNVRAVGDVGALGGRLRWFFLLGSRGKTCSLGLCAN